MCIFVYVLWNKVLYMLLLSIAIFTTDEADVLFSFSLGSQYNRLVYAFAQFTLLPGQLMQPLRNVYNFSFFTSTLKCIFASKISNRKKIFTELNTKINWNTLLRYNKRCENEWTAPCTLQNVSHATIHWVHVFRHLIHLVAWDSILKRVYLIR